MSSDGFDAARALCKARAMGRCECCQHEGTDAHHREHRGMGGVFGAGAEQSNTAANLVWLCRRCHSWAHSKLRDARARGLYVPHGARMPALVPVRLWTAGAGKGWWLLDDEPIYRYPDNETYLRCDTARSVDWLYDEPDWEVEAA